VDVYSDWVDACDAVAKDTANQYDGSASAHAGNSKPDPSADVGHGDTYEEEDY
jgi:transcription elongation factor Elf1